MLSGTCRAGFLFGGDAPCMDLLPRWGDAEWDLPNGICQTGFAGQNHYLGSSRITLHGLPAAKTLAGTSLTTTLPAPMVVLAPMVTF